MAGGKTAAQTVSAQPTSHCLDGRENVTGVACYRIFKPVGQTYLCPNSIFSGLNLVVEALGCLQVGQGSGTRDLGDSPHRVESHGKLSAPMCLLVLSPTLGTRHIRPGFEWHPSLSR